MDIREEVGRKLRRAAKGLAKTHTPAHALYFGLVAVEAGKWYGAVAGVLLIITIVEAFTHPTGETPHVD